MTNCSDNCASLISLCWLSKMNSLLFSTDVDSFPIQLTELCLYNYSVIVITLHPIKKEIIPGTKFG